MNIFHQLVEPIGRIRRGSNPHCSRDMLRRGRVLQLGRRRRPSVSLMVAAAIVDRLAGGRKPLVGALLPSAALLAAGSHHVSEHE